jgi:hypothetical protein
MVLDEVWGGGHETLLKHCLNLQLFSFCTKKICFQPFILSSKYIFTKDRRGGGELVGRRE